MEREFELGFGRDLRGNRKLVRLPKGMAKPGMVARLFGGVFLLLEEVLPWCDGLEEAAAAAELLTPIWGRELNAVG